MKCHSFPVSNPEPHKDLQPVANARQVLEIQEEVKRIKVAEAIKEYIAEIAAL